MTIPAPHTAALKECHKAEDVYKRQATADVTITGLPGTVSYGQKFTLAASQTGDTTSANKKWTWDYDQEYFKLVGPNANTETITLQAIKAGTPSKGITATYESGTHKGSATVNAVVEKKEVTVTAGSYKVSKTYDGTTCLLYTSRCV